MSVHPGDPHTNVNWSALTGALTLFAASVITSAALAVADRAHRAVLYDSDDGLDDSPSARLVTRLEKIEAQVTGWENDITASRSNIADLAVLRNLRALNERLRPQG